MTPRPSALEEGLVRELRHWLGRALAEVGSLPTATTIRWRSRAGVARDLAVARHALEAVRLYAAECLEVNAALSLSPATRDVAALAVTLCRDLEREVSVVDHELLIYAR